MDCKYRSILLRKIISMVKNWKEKKIPTFLQGKKSKVWDLHYHDIIDDSVSFITRQQKEHHWDFHLEFPTTHELKWSICNKAMQNNKVSDFQKKKKIQQNSADFAYYQFHVKRSPCVGSTQPQAGFTRDPAHICRMVLNMEKRVVPSAGISSFVCNALIFPS